MMYFEEMVYEKITDNEQGLEKGHYENCSFVNCDFSSADLSGFNFTDCSFKECNLSMTKLLDTQFNDISFTNCKVLGLKFEMCNPFLFKVRFFDCYIQLSSFYGVKLKNTVFRNCNVLESDFTETDLSSTVFDACNLLHTTFEHTILIKTDFSSSFNFSIHPEVNKLGKTRFGRHTLEGLLHKYDIIIS